MCFFLAFLLNIRSKIWILYLVRKTEIVGKKLLSFRWFYVSIVLDFWNDMNLQFRKHNKMHFQKDIPSHLPLPWSKQGDLFEKIWRTGSGYEVTVTRILGKDFRTKSFYKTFYQQYRFTVFRLKTCINDTISTWSQDIGPCN